MTNFIKKLANDSSVKGNCCGVEIKEVSAQSQEKGAESCCSTEAQENGSSCCTTDAKDTSTPCC